MANAGSFLPPTVYTNIIRSGLRGAHSLTGHSTPHPCIILAGADYLWSHHYEEKKRSAVQEGGERHVAKAVCVRRVDYFSGASPGRPDPKMQHPVRQEKIKTLRSPPMSDTHAPVASLNPTRPSLTRKTEQNKTTDSCQSSLSHFPYQIAVVVATLRPSQVTETPPAAAVVVIIIVRRHVTPSLPKMEEGSSSSKRGARGCHHDRRDETKTATLTPV